MTKSKKILRRTFFSFSAFMLIWTGLTFWAQYSGESSSIVIGDLSATKTAFIVYNPDPIYNLDEQVCESFAIGLTSGDIKSNIYTVQQAEEIGDISGYDLYVFCANTYNWAPDWKVSNFIEHQKDIRNQTVVAITLGSGSTTRAQRLLEEQIKKTGGHLIGSKSYWLLRPNDETRMEENNVKVANDMARVWGQKISQLL